MFDIRPIPINDYFPAHRALERTVIYGDKPYWVKLQKQSQYQISTCFNCYLGLYQIGEDQARSLTTRTASSG